MSTSEPSPSTSPAPSGDIRRVVGTYDDYEGAQAAVDWLSDAGFAVERTAIVGTGLRYVEQVSGRLTTGRAALTGAGQGLLIGLFLALLFGLFFTGPNFLWLLLYGLVVGALFGAILGAAGHAALDGQRDFASVSGMRADRYEVMADQEVADEAADLLARMPRR